MKSRQNVLLVSLFVVFLLVVVYLKRSNTPASKTPSTSAALDTELELLTILGDVQDRRHEMPGRWREARTGETLRAGVQEPDKQTGELLSLPYLQGYRQAAPGEQRVTVHDPESVFPGVNVYTSGHAAQAFLMDMDGETLHKWHFDIDDVWPDVPKTVHGTFWRRVHAFPNKDLLAIYEGIGMIKLDKDSNLLWAFKGGCHHEAFVTEDRNIYVLTRRAVNIPRINGSSAVVSDGITILDADGNEIESFSVLESLESSIYKSLLETMPSRGDILHTNSLVVFDGSLASVSPHFKKGNILVSILKLDAIAIIDPEKRRVVWARSGAADGLWRRQHDPAFLPDGHLLIFDNQGHGGTSRAVEYDLVGERLVWQYAGHPDDVLYSKTCGTVERLPNGNTLITESDNGRALEVTNDNDVVWEFYNPNRAGEDNRLIATLFEVCRFDTDYFDG